MQIYKKRLDVDEEINTIYLPYKTAEEARKAIMHVNCQFGTPCIWYEHNKEMEREEFGEFTVMAVESHEDVSNIFNEEEYIGTVYFDKFDKEVPYSERHYYLVESKEMSARLEKRTERLKKEVEQQKTEAEESKVEVLMLQLPCYPGIEVIELPFERVEEAREHIKCIDLNAEIPTIWYEVSKENKTAMKQFLVVTVGTGFDMEGIVSREEYIGTALFAGGSLVWHYFLVDKAEYSEKHDIEWLDETE